MEDTCRMSEGPYHVYLDNQQEKSLVFCEGFFCMKGISTYMLQHISTRNVYSYEMINHFDPKRWQDDMSYEAMALDLLRFVDQQGLNKFAISGVCVGARLAIKFAAMFPERVDALIVVEGSVKGFQLPYIHDMVRCMTEIEGKPQG